MEEYANIMSEDSNIPIIPEYPTVGEKLKDGDYVTYPSLKGNIECVVLYDNSSEYGVQIISKDKVEEVTLGANEKYELTDSIDSYNNAISILNSKAREYNNGEYSSSARCVGSVPNNPDFDQAGMYKIDEPRLSEYDEILKDADTNYITDYNKMGTLGIRKISSIYWLASRFAGAGLESDMIEFGIKYIDSVDSTEGIDGRMGGFVSLYPLESESYEYTYGLRPVFTLISEVKVIGGEGTEESPYILDI